MSSHLFQWRLLKTRVTLFTLVIFVLSVWSLAFYISRLLQNDMQRVLGEQQFATVSLIAADVNDELSDRLAALEQIAKQFDAPLMGKPAALQARLEQRPILQILFNGGIFITDLDGTAIADVQLSAGRIGTIDPALMHLKYSRSSPNGFDGNDRHEIAAAGCAA